MKKKDIIGRIEVSLMALTGIVLLYLGNLGREIIEIVKLQQVFGAVFVFTFLLYLAYRTSKDRFKSPIGWFPIVADIKKIPQMIVVSLAFGIGFNYFLKMSTFSFQSLFSLETAEIITLLPAFYALAIFGLFFPKIEESFLNLSSVTLSKWFGYGGLDRVKSITFAILLSALMFVIAHLYLGMVISTTFIVFAFAFAGIGRLLNWRYHSYLPWLIVHSFDSSQKIGVFYSLQWYVWCLPTLMIILPFLYLYLTNNRKGGR